MSPFGWNTAVPPFYAQLTDGVSWTNQKSKILVKIEFLILNLQRTNPFERKVQINAKYERKF